MTNTYPYLSSQGFSCGIYIQFVYEDLDPYLPCICQPRVSVVLPILFMRVLIHTYPLHALSAQGFSGGIYIQFVYEDLDPYLPCICQPRVSVVLPILFMRVLIHTYPLHALSAQGCSDGIYSVCS